MGTILITLVGVLALIVVLATIGSKTKYYDRED